MGPPAATTNLPSVHCAEGQIERVISLKLLGLHLDADFSWQSHRGCYPQSDEATVLSKAVKARWCPLCTTVTLLFGCYQTSFEICSSSLASLI